MLTTAESPGCLTQPATPDRAGSSDSILGRGGLVHLRASVMGICPPSCRCQCHVRRSRLKSTKFDLLAPILGSFLLSYNITPVWQWMGCTEPDCKRSGQTARFNYTFPAWLCSRAISLQLSLSCMTNLGATLHFTIGRTLSFNDMGVQSILYGTPGRFLARGRTYYPCDITNDGTSLLEVSTASSSELPYQVLAGADCGLVDHYSREIRYARLLIEPLESSSSFSWLRGV